MTPILQQHAKRILSCGNKSSLFRFYATLWSPEASQTMQLRIKAALHPTQPSLDQWQQQEKQLYIRVLIKNLRDSNRFSQELEASKRMGEEKVCTLFEKDYPARLHLIETVLLGLEEAEKFFKSIPSDIRDHSIFATLLTLYTKSEKTLDKAESTFKKTRELRFLSKPSPFNSMMSLYSQLGKPNMVETANHVLKAYAAVSNVKAMHMFMRMWVDEEGLKLERDTIVEMTNAYVRVYSEMYGGSAREMLHTLWDECKKSEEGFQTVINSLSKLDDIEGEEDMHGEGTKNEHDLEKRNMVEKLLYEMEENKVKPDSVIANHVLKAYVDVSNVKAMKMFMRMWVDEKGIKLEKHDRCNGKGTKLERNTIVAMAKAYVKVCLEGKAIEMYGDVAGRAREVHSLWDECKKKAKASEERYQTMISSLWKLDVSTGERRYMESGKKRNSTWNWLKRQGWC